MTLARHAAGRMGRNVRALFLGNAVYALGQWGQLAILARVAGPGGVGKYVFALSLTAPLMMLANLQLRMLIATDRRGAYTFAEYRRLRLVTTALALLAIFLVGALSGEAPELWRVLVPVAAMRAADELADVYYGIWQRGERMATVGWTLGLNAMASTALMLASAALGGGVAGAATGAALGSGAALAYIHARTALDRELRSDAAGRPLPGAWRRIGRLALEAAPLGVIILLVSLQHNLPRYFIQHHAGEAALGMFAAASQLTAAGGLVVAALGSAASPRLATLHETGDQRRFGALTRRMVLAGAALGIVGVAISLLFGREILGHIYRPEFGSAAGVLVVLSVGAAAAFPATLLGQALTSARIIRVQPILLTAVVAVLTACSAFLVPRFGAVGAAWAVAVASLAHAIANRVALGTFRTGRSPARGTVRQLLTRDVG